MMALSMTWHVASLHTPLINGIEVLPAGALVVVLSVVHAASLHTHGGAVGCVVDGWRYCGCVVDDMACCKLMLLRCCQWRSWMLVLS